MITTMSGVTVKVMGSRRKCDVLQSGVQDVRCTSRDPFAIHWVCYMTEVMLAVCRYIRSA
jgi:hypothetical protein